MHNLYIPSKALPQIKTESELLDSVKEEPAEGKHLLFLSGKRCSDDELLPTDLRATIPDFYPKEKRFYVTEDRLRGEASYSWKYSNSP